MKRGKESRGEDEGAKKEATEERDGGKGRGGATEALGAWPCTPWLRSCSWSACPPRWRGEGSRRGGRPLPLPLPAFARCFHCLDISLACLPYLSPSLPLSLPREPPFSRQRTMKQARARLWPSLLRRRLWPSLLRRRPLEGQLPDEAAAQL
jgi:hypothetical protein